MEEASMELRSVKCNNCGNTLDLKPWQSNITCPYCKTVYRVESAEKEHERPTAGSGSADNPVDVVLVPVEDDVINIGLRYAPDRWIDIGHDGDPLYGFDGVLRFTDKCVRFRYGKEGFDGSKEKDPFLLFADKVRRTMYFFMLLSEQTGSRYQIDVGSMYMDMKPLYDRRTYPRIPDYDSISFDPKYYEEPDTWYYGGEDSLNGKREKGILTGVSKAERDRFFSEQNHQTDDLIKELELEYTDTIRHQKLFYESYVSSRLFGSMRSAKSRAWTLQFKHRRLFTAVDPASAARVMPASCRETASKVGHNPCVETIVRRLYKEFAEEEKAELHARQQENIQYNVALYVRKDVIGFSGKIYDRSNLVKSYSKEVTFNELGMNHIDDLFIRNYLAACVLAGILNDCKTDGSVGWNVVGLTDVTDDSYATWIKLKLAASTVGVYNDWV